MIILQAVKQDKSIYHPITKFDKNLKKLLLLMADREYTTKFFNECFDKAMKITECEKCDKKGIRMINGTMYCKKHKS